MGKVMEEKIFNPLAMTDTFFDVPNNKKNSGVKRTVLSALKRSVGFIMIDEKILFNTIRAYIPKADDDYVWLLTRKAEEKINCYGQVVILNMLAKQVERSENELLCRIGKKT